jgi:hypothetical protein
MNKDTFSTKRIAIDKATTQMVTAVAVAAFVAVFSLIAAHALWSERGYLSRVTAAKEKAHKQLQENIKAVSSLEASYTTFVGTPTNIIGGDSTGSGDKDGENAKIVLDALPPQYDFPALTASIEKILKQRNFTVGAIGGTDDQIAQQSNQTSPNPEPVSIPFNFSVTNANYASVQDLVGLLQSSIRPIQMDVLTISGGANNMQLSVTAHTYYQPGKDLKITTQVIK